MNYGPGQFPSEFAIGVVVLAINIQYSETHLNRIGRGDVTTVSNHLRFRCVKDR